ncbi:MAG: 3-dehydroquinate synthase [Candidatus Marinamargulisbacteria bacterium]
MTSALKTYYINISSSKKYPIVFGESALSCIDKNDLSGATKAVIVTNQTILDQCAHLINELTAMIDLEIHTIIINDGEAYKSLETVQTIVDECLEFGVGRKDVLFSIGGGVVGDMAGFAASIYLRGISFFQVPTSLLAQVDAAIGGKTGVNHAIGKNLIGTFYQPKKTLIDPRFLATLPEAQMKEGLAEVIKYGVIMDKPLFWYLEEHTTALNTFHYDNCPDVWQFIIDKSIQNKAHVVSKDERESEYREILNFGHTIGHAIESVYGYQTVTHGQAVALGMVAESKLSLTLKHLTSETYDRIKALIDSFNYDFDLNQMDPEAFFKALTRDKKARQGVVRYVVPTDIGQTKTIEGVSEDAIKAVLNAVFGGDIL